MILDWLVKKIGTKATKTLVILWYVFLLLLIITCIETPQGRIKYLDW